MKIVNVNKFYYQRGGDCVAAMTLEELLTQKGHEVATFSSGHPQNVPSKWSDYFVSEVNFTHASFNDKRKAIGRVLFAGEIKQKFSRLLDDFKPDVVHLHNIHTYLSPAIAQIAHKRGIKVVWTLHDYKLVCPCYSLLRDGTVCEECFTDKYAVLKHRCVKGSLAGSALAFVEAMQWNPRVLQQCVDTFITPSRFLKEKMVEFGYRPEKIETIHNFMNVTYPEVTPGKDDFYCYSSRISPEKGIDLLLRVAAKLPYRLVVMGDGERLEEYRETYKDANIEFRGFVKREEALAVLGKARFTVHPSICLDNSPYAVKESLCMRTPVLCANHGGMPEMVESGVNGFVFTPHDEADLERMITRGFEVFDDAFDYERIGEEAREAFSEEAYYSQIMSIYEQ